MLSWSWKVFLTWLWGKFTPSPIAVRVGPALKPARPSSTISREGIDSDRGSNALVAFALRRNAPRTSLIHLDESTLVNCRFTPCVRAGTADENPGGVI